MLDLEVFGEQPRRRARARLCLQEAALRDSTLAVTPFLLTGHPDIAPDPTRVGAVSLFATSGCRVRCLGR